jgi:hypothetical protein
VSTATGKIELEQLAMEMCLASPVRPNDVSNGSPEHGLVNVVKAVAVSVRSMN